MGLSQYFDKRGLLFWKILGYGSVIVMGIIDYLTSYELSFSLFYVAPIALVAWYVGQQFGLTLSVTSAITWLIADIVSGHSYSHPIIYLWNTLIRFGFFVIITRLLANLRKAYSTEQEFAQTDFISGAANARYFYTLAQNEIHRSRRYQRPFTIAYLDLDDFKAVNDRFGHSMGDKVLQTMTNLIKHDIRNIDTIARLGGDEFTLLLPETGGAEAQIVLNRIRHHLLEEFKTHGWPVTVSIGVVTCLDVHDSVDRIVQVADDVMYSIKANGKNGIGFIIRTDKDP